jgi:tagatose 6-phosphate kinase
VILTVTLNPALDCTYEVERLEPDESHRVLATHVRAGGKGVNVARVLALLGRPVVMTGLAGGVAGAELRTELAALAAAADLADEFVNVRGETRRTVAVVPRAGSGATVFNEPGPRISEAEWEEFTSRFAVLARESELVVLSGSLPPGVPVDGYARLVRAAREQGRSTVLDADGPALIEALAAGPSVVKPNAAELAAAAPAPAPAAAPAPAPAAVHAPTAADFDPAFGAADLVRRGAGAVVASLGPRGLYAHTPDGIWRAAPPGPVAGNPTGAGDACVAAIAAGLAAGAGWPEILREAVALSAAAVLSPVAGGFDPQARRRLLTETTVEEVNAAHPDR